MEFANTYFTYGRDSKPDPKIKFNPQGNKVITASSDKTCRIWSTETGSELQLLGGQPGEGHEDEVISCSFNYEGDTIITGSKDNTCRIWKDVNLIRTWEEEQASAQ